MLSLLPTLTRINRLSLRPASIPPGFRVYVIGDVHGRGDLLGACRDAIMADIAADPIAHVLTITLGDYIDRGPDSSGVIDILVHWPAHANLVALRGNHEQMLLDFLRNPASLQTWRRLGGLETLQSYGVPIDDVMHDQGFGAAHALLRSLLPPAHYAFLRRTGFSLSLGDYFFCHAGVRPGVHLEAQSPMDLLSIRYEFLGATGDFGKVVVHGHTPVAEPELRPNRINIDTGAYATGRLTCLVLEADHARFLVPAAG
jgi:serine/threonine protein phosphatase 1